MNSKTFNDCMTKLHKLFLLEEDSDRLKEYWLSLKDINDEIFVKVCDYLKLNFTPVPHKRFPIIGDFLDTVRKVKPSNVVMEDVPYNERASIEEVGLYLKIVTEIYSLIELKLDAFNKNHCLPSWNTPTGAKQMDFVEWARRDFPPTWCKTMDHFSKGAYAAYLNDSNGKHGFFVEFLRNYYEKLIEKKQKRLEEIRKEK